MTSSAFEYAHRISQQLALLESERLAYVLRCKTGRATISAQDGRDVKELLESERAAWAQRREAIKAKVAALYRAARDDGHDVRQLEAVVENRGTDKGRALVKKLVKMEGLL